MNDKGELSPALEANKMTKGDIRIGTSGWVYAHWTGKFYPNNRLDKLDFYSKLFDTVEVNMTFYRLPREPLIAAWDNTVRL
jgi:uncharacterized protein YecE (DUF72 family)